MKYLIAIISISILTACASVDPKRARDVVFKAHNQEVLRFGPDGYVAVRGNPVTKDAHIWKGFLMWWQVTQTAEYKQCLGDLRAKAKEQK